MKECHFVLKSTFLCVMAFCASGLATCSSAHLIESSNRRIESSAGLNERMPLHNEIDVSMCNGILRFWLGHFGSSAHLIGDRMVSSQ